MTYDRKRWPGWDGWVAATVGVVSGAVGVLTNFSVPPLLLAGLSAAYVGFTALVRRVTRPLYDSPSTPKILTVVPTKDNEGSIVDVIEGCLQFTEDVLVVNDGCTDTTPSLAAQTRATVLHHAENRGKGAALESALDWAAERGFTHIVAIDADGQHNPEDLPSFFEAVRAHPEAVVAGVRDMTKAPKGAQYARANSNFWVWVETSQRMGDTQCGYRAYPVASTRALHLVPSRYQWEVEVLVRAVWAGIPVIDHPCEVYYPPKEERVSSYRKFVDTARISWLNAHLIAERILWPPRWFLGRRG